MEASLGLHQELACSGTSGIVVELLFGLVCVQ